MSRPDEMVLLRNISDLRKERDALADWATADAEVHTLREKRSEISDKMKELSVGMREMRNVVRKLGICARVRSADPTSTCEVGDMRTADVFVPAVCVARLIGKAGKGLRDIETASETSLDVLDASETPLGGAGAGAPMMGTIVRVMGLPAGIARVQQIIADLSSHTDMTIPVSPLLGALLLANKGTCVQDLQTQLDLRIRVDKLGPDNLPLSVTARGLPASLKALKAAFDAAEAGKVVLLYDSRDVPIIIGKAGVNMKRMREETGCEVNVSRPMPGVGGGLPQTAVSLLSMGPNAASNILLAVAIFKEVLDVQGEIEEVIPVKRDAVPWIVGKGGERIQAFQRECGVHARILRSDDMHGVDPAFLGPDGAAVMLRGTREKLLRARPAFDAIHLEYKRSNIVFRLRPDQVRVLIGPGGVSIRQLRAAAGVAIEVEEATGVSAVTEASSEVVSGGGLGVADVDGAGVALARGSGGGGGRGARPNRADEYQLPEGHAVVSVRGEPEKVAEAVQMLRDVISSARTIKVAITSAVANHLFRKGKNEVMHALENETGAFITRDADAPALGMPSATTAVYAIIFGTNLAVAAAEAKLNALVDTVDEVSVAIPNAAVVGELVGKNGANIKVILAETGASVEIIRDRGVVVISGLKSNVAAAKARVVDIFNHHAAVSAVLQVDPSQVSSIIGRGGSSLRALQFETNAEIHVEDSGAIYVKGSTPAALSLAVSKLREKAHLDAPAVESLHMDDAVIGRVIGRKGSNMQKIERDFNVFVSVDTATGVLTLRGDIAAVARARAEFSKQVNDLNEGSFSIPISAVSSIIGARGAHLKATEAETGARINLPRDTRSEGVAADALVLVRTRGSPIAVALAHAAITAQVARRAYCIVSRPSAVVCASDNVGLSAAVAAALKDSSASDTHAFVTVHDAPADGSAYPLSVIFCEVNHSAFLPLAIGAIDRALSSARKAATADFFFRLAEHPTAVSGLLGADFEAAVKAAGAAGGAVETDAAHARAYTIVWGTPSGVATASTLVSNNVAALEARCAIEMLPAWAIGTFCGKEMSGVFALEKRCGAGASVRVDNTTGAVRVAVAEASDLTAALELVRDAIATVLRSQALFQIPLSSISQVIGKGGATIKALQVDSGASVSLDRDTQVLTVSASTSAAVDVVHARVIELCAGDGQVKSLSHEAVAALTRSFSFASLGFLAPSGLMAVEPLLRGGWIDRGVHLSLSRDGATLFLKALTPEDVDRAALKLPAAVETARSTPLPPPPQQQFQAAVAPYLAVADASAAALPRSASTMMVGGKDKIMTKNTRKRLNKKARAAGEAGQVDDEEPDVPDLPLAVPVAVAVLPIVVAPAVVVVTAALWMPPTQSPKPTGAAAEMPPVSSRLPPGLSGAGFPHSLVPAAPSLYHAAVAAPAPPKTAVALGQAGGITSASIQDELLKLGLSLSTVDFIRAPAGAVGGSAGVHYHNAAAAAVQMQPRLMPATTSAPRAGPPPASKAGPWGGLAQRNVQAFKVNPD